MASRSTTKTPDNTGDATGDTPAKTKPAKPALDLVTETAGAAIASPDLKKSELIQLVAERANLRNNKVKPVVEAMLEVLGEAIQDGRELNLNPFGKVKINRQKDTGNARVTVAKIRQSAAPKDTADEG